MDLIAENQKNAHAFLIDMLKDIERFNVFSDQDLESLVSLSRFEEHQPGDVIMREGDYDTWVYILIEGAAEIVRNGKILCYLHQKGDMFGEMGVVDGAPRSATIRATEHTLVLCFDAAIIDRQLNNNEVRFCYVIYRLFSEVLSARLRATNENVQYLEALSRSGNPTPR